MTGFKADKSLGQHFLHDQTVIQKIATKPNQLTIDTIIEVGPGPGALVSALLSYGLPYFALEADERFVTHLSEKFSSAKIIHCDALEFDLKAFFEQEDLTQKNIWLVSNLPYNIASPLLIKFLPQTQIKALTLMFQKEVARKVVPSLDEKNSASSLASLTQTYFHSRYLFNVPPGAFNPPPKVQSGVIELTRLESPRISLNEFGKFERFLRQLFQFKRKTIANNLKSYVTQSNLLAACQILKIAPSQRAESLNLEKIQLLYTHLKG